MQRTIDVDGIRYRWSLVDLSQLDVRIADQSARFIRCDVLITCTARDCTQASDMRTTIITDRLLRCAKCYARATVIQRDTDTLDKDAHE